MPKTTKYIPPAESQKSSAPQSSTIAANPETEEVSPAAASIKRHDDAARKARAYLRKALPKLSDSKAEMLAAFLDILRNDQGTITPIEQFIWSLVVRYK